MSVTQAKQRNTPVTQAIGYREDKFWQKPRQQIVPTCIVLLGLPASTLSWSAAVDDPLDATEIVSWKEKKNDGYKKLIIRGLKSAIYFQESRNLLLYSKPTYSYLYLSQS